MGGFSASSKAQNAPAAIEQNASPSRSNPDPAILAQGIAAAPGISPPDAPKDPYGKPYYIGNLGGQKVNLPRGVVNFLEYDDSPDWDPEKIKNYRPPVRSYDSPIMSFGFDFRNRDQWLVDLYAEDGSWQAYEKVRYQPDHDWVRASITSGSRYGSVEYPAEIGLQMVLDRKFPGGGKYVKSPEPQYGLEVYTATGISPRTGEEWRYESGPDQFFGRNTDGRIEREIQCNNNRIPSRENCTHTFSLRGSYKVRVSLWYDRTQLPHWQEIEDNAREILWRFTLPAQNPSSNTDQEPSNKE